MIIESNIKPAVYRDKLFSRYFIDHLTSLPNLYKLRSDLEDRADFSLIVLNIDNFQMINNFYGSLVGDFVLETVGKLLSARLHALGIYRLLGDEFAILMDGSLGFYDLKSFIRDLRKQIGSIVVVYKDIEIFIDFTLASSVTHKNQDVFSKIAMAMKYAKDVGADFWIYEDRMQFENEYERNLQLSLIVREAVLGSKIIPFFQAIIDNKSEEVVKYECLARLVDKNDRIVSPLVFIPIAKKIKAYKHITIMMIAKSFEAFRDNDFTFSINLSIEDIMSSDIFEFIMDTLKNSPASNRVIFELLESEAIEDFRKVERFISEIRRYGAKIAFDDFGSGYSNFKYLTKIKPDFLKIDGSLIQDIDIDSNSKLVVESIVDFARKLGVQTIAEFVHTSPVLDVVKSVGIDFSQGFYIDEPSIELKL